MADPENTTLIVMIFFGIAALCVICMIGVLYNKLLGIEEKLDLFLRWVNSEPDIVRAELLAEVREEELYIVPPELKEK